MPYARHTAEAALGCVEHVVGPDALLPEIARSALVDGKAANQVFGAEIEPDILELDAQRPNVLCMVEDCLHHRIADLRIEVRHGGEHAGERRSEEHTSELQSLMSNSYAVISLKKKKTKTTHDNTV